MITKTRDTERRVSTAPIAALTEAAKHGEFVRFRGLLEPERQRLLVHALGQLPNNQAEECVETALTLAFRRFLYRPTELSLMRWLFKLLHEAIQQRPPYEENLDDEHA
jgi:hypothetical protein